MVIAGGESDTCKVRIVKRRVQLTCVCASVHACGHDRAALTRRRDTDGPLRVDERSFYRKHALSGNWQRNWQKLFQFKPINPDPEEESRREYRQIGDSIKKVTSDLEMFFI